MKPPLHTRMLMAAALSALAALAVAIPAWAEAQSSSTGAGEASSTEESSPAAGEDATSTADSPDAEDSATGESRTEAGVSSAAEADGEETARRERRAFGDRTLRPGDRGRDVRRLQKILRHLNFPTRVTKRYDRDTKRQVRRFDMWKEKEVNGVVHPRQARRMKKLERRGARYRNHVFPIRGAHDYGGSGSRFGAPRSGHTHQGQDVSAAEGTKLVAAHEGKVAYVQYQAGGAGHYVVIRGKDGSDSAYMHMREAASVTAGQRVLAGQKIGRVGNTGSSTGPHLHFELWTPHWYNGGYAYDPLQKLQKWDRRT